MHFKEQDDQEDEKTQNRFIPTVSSQQINSNINQDDVKPNIYEDNLYNNASDASSNLPDGYYNNSSNVTERQNDSSIENYKGIIEDDNQFSDIAKTDKMRKIIQDYDDYLRSLMMHQQQQQNSFFKVRYFFIRKNYIGHNLGNDKNIHFFSTSPYGDDAV